MAPGCPPESVVPSLQSGESARIQEQLARILRSEAFRHSEQLRTLLSYLTQRSLSGDAGELKEYSVGIDALGKRESYSPRQDATVRIQVGRLRTRLEEYFRSEGLADPVVFSLPKGGFKIVFEPREAAAPAVEPAPNTTPAHWKDDVRVWRGIAAGLALVAVAALCFAVLPPRGRPAPGNALAAAVWTPELSQIWQPFLDDNRPLTLSLGTPLFVVVDGIPVRDSQMNQWQEGQLSATVERFRRAIRATEVHPAYRYNGFGETAGAFRLFRLFLARGKDLSFRRANDLSWDDFKERDLVLLGSPKSVSHLKNFRDLRTRLAFDVEENRILNDDPAPGEAREYQKTDAADNGIYQTYALVTRLPGLDGSGNMMILGSPDTEGTMAACEYVTAPALARELVREFGGGRDGLPRAYQILLRVSVRNEIPLHIRAVAKRVLR